MCIRDRYRAAAQRLEAVREQVAAAEQDIVALEKQKKALSKWRWARRPRAQIQAGAEGAAFVLLRNARHPCGF